MEDVFHKVPHKNLMKVWRLIYFSLILEDLSTNKTVNSSINGISLSPKEFLYNKNMVIKL